MSKGLGKRQREVLAKLADHRDNPPDYDVRVKKARKGGYLTRYDVDRYPEWMTINELVDLRPSVWGTRMVRYDSDIESTRRAVHKLEAAGLVETRWVWRHGQRGQRQLGVRLAPADTAVTADPAATPREAP